MAPAPKGAFVIRDAPHTADKTDFCLSVQTGLQGRVCNVLIKREQAADVTWWNIHPTPHFFESLFDLVLYCSVQPFHFRNIDPTNKITLDLAAAVEAARLYEARKKEKRKKS